MILLPKKQAAFGERGLNGYSLIENGLIMLPGGRGLCLGAGKTQSQKNACKPR